MSRPNAPAAGAPSDLARVLAEGTNRQRLEVIRTRDALPDADHAELLRAAPGWKTLFRLIWRHPDPAVRAAGLGLAADAGLLGEGPAVLERLADEREEVREAAGASAIALAERADAAVRSGAAEVPGRRAFVDALAKLVRSDDAGRDAAAHWLTIAASTADEALTGALDDPQAGPRMTAALLSDRHPGAVRALLGLLSLRRPPRAALRAAGRTDLGFLIPLLTVVHRAGAGTLPGLPPLPWFAEPGAILEQLPPRLQPAVLELAERLCEPGGGRRAVRMWMLARGGAAARRGAEPALRELPAGGRWRILAGALRSSDEDVIAWATGLLVAQRMPGWPRLLPALAAHPAGAVRAAAAAALRDAAEDSAGGPRRPHFARRRVKSIPATSARRAPAARR